MAEADNNQSTAHWIARQFNSYGYETSFQGEYSNVIALPKNATAESLILVGAHYDSVPECPAADDNGSAVASMLACAKAVAEHAPPRRPIGFVAFNCEEDGFLGSADFVSEYLLPQNLKLRNVHILEMLGYCDHQPGSQKVPRGLPIQLPTTADFLGLLANGNSAASMKTVLQIAKSYTPEFPVLGLAVPPGAEILFPVLARSDHVPFWKADLPALMWTDTSEFRNPHYHQVTDTPDTLDYTFLHTVTQVLLATVLTESAPL